MATETYKNKIKQLEFENKVLKETIKELVSEKSEIEEKLIQKEKQFKDLAVAYQKDLDRAKSKYAPKHNSRGAGRKATITNEEKAEIRKERENGLTIVALSEKFNRSVGSISNIINS